MRTCRPALLAALVPALALLLWAAPAEAQSPPAPGSVPGDAVAHDPACDPAVAEALAGSAEAGVEADLAIIRHEEQGIRNPDSILDFSCITDLFDYRSFDIHLRSGGRARVHPGSRPPAHLRRRPRRLPALCRPRPRPLGLRLGVHPASRPPSRPRYRLAEAATSSMTCARATPAASCSGMR